MRNGAYSQGTMKDLLNALKSLADETRLRILYLILQRECCVCEVMQVLGISQSRASRNLTMLYDAGFLTMRKQSLWVYYSINQDFSPVFLATLTKAISEALADDKQAVKDLKSLAQSVRVVCCLKGHCEKTNE